jgi:hypothetical protein
MKTRALETILEASGPVILSAGSFSSLLGKLEFLEMNGFHSYLHDILLIYISICLILSRGEELLCDA